MFSFADHILYLNQCSKRVPSGSAGLAYLLSEQLSSVAHNHYRVRTVLYSWKSLGSLFFMVSIDHLFINLKSWTINYCFEKKNGKSLEFFIKKSVRTLSLTKTGKKGLRASKMWGLEFKFFRALLLLTLSCPSMNLLVLYSGVWKSREELKAIRCSQSLFQPKASIRERFLKTFDEWKEALHRSKNWYKWE